MNQGQNQHAKPDPIDKADESSAGETKQQPDSGEHDVENAHQLEVGKKAKLDMEGRQVDTDRYNTSGNDADPPKTSENNRSAPNTEG